MQATEQQHEHVYRQMIEAENARDYDRVYSFLSPDFTYWSSETRVDGIEAARAEDRPILSAFPDHQRTIEEVIVKDQWVIARWRFTGTHQAALLELPPTNRRIDVTGCTMMEFGEDGKVKNVWRFTDRMAILQQIGLMPSVEGDAGVS